MSESQLTAVDELTNNPNKTIKLDFGASDVYVRLNIEDDEPEFEVAIDGVLGITYTQHPRDEVEAIIREADDKEVKHMTKAFYQSYEDGHRHQVWAAVDNRDELDEVGTPGSEGAKIFFEALTDY